MRRLLPLLLLATQVASTGQTTSQELYDRALIGDAQRRAVGVPVFSEQEAQRREWDAKRAGAAARP